MKRDDEEDEYLTMLWLWNRNRKADQSSSEGGEEPKGTSKGGGGALLLLLLMFVAYASWNWLPGIVNPKKVDAEPAVKNAAKSETDQKVSTVQVQASGNNFLYLPLTGKYRFAMPKDTTIDKLTIGPRGGYVDRFGNEWVPIKRKVAVVRWQEYLSNDGLFRLGMLKEGKRSIQIGTDGRPVH